MAITYTMRCKYIASLLTLLLCIGLECVTIEGWIFADNWFEFYFNGVKIITDPIVFQPKNAVKVRFEAPHSGLYSFAFYAKDYANDVTGLEYEDTCLGDGGIRISLSDGTISNASWKCVVEMEGPINPIQCGLNNGDCTPTGAQCRVQYNSVPSCWNETICDTTTVPWVNASEYADELIGFGKLKNGQTMDCGDAIECSLAKQVNWTQYGPSTFIWTSDLLYDNRIMCRYQYFMDASTPSVSVTVSPTLSTPPAEAHISHTESPSSSPTPVPATLIPSQTPTSRTAAPDILFPSKHPTSHSQSPTSSTANPSILPISPPSVRVTVSPTMPAPAPMTSVPTMSPTMPPTSASVMPSKSPIATITTSTPSQSRTYRTALPSESPSPDIISPSEFPTSTTSALSSSYSQSPTSTTANPRILPTNKVTAAPITATDIAPYTHNNNNNNNMSAPEVLSQIHDARGDDMWMIMAIVFMPLFAITSVSAICLAVKMWVNRQPNIKTIRKSGKVYNQTSIDDSLL